MMKYLLVVFLLIYYGLSFSQKIDSDASYASFSLSNMKVNTVKGRLTDLTGEIKFDPQKLSDSYFDVSMSATTINTNSNGRDKHLKKEDYFDVASFPKIKFISSSIKKLKAKGYYTVDGNLTIKDVTKKVSIIFSYQDSSLKGSFTINRLDYNVGEGVSLFLIGNEVKIFVKAKLN